MTERMHAGKMETRMSVETPEGVELQLTPAGPGPRILAYILDWMIRLGFLSLLSLLFAYLDLLGQGLYFLIFFLLEWFYPVLFETFRQGATPGKRVMGLRVLHDNGTPVSFTGSMIRNLLRVVDFLPLFYVLGFFSMLMARDFKRLGDLAAGTLVVYDTERPRLPSARVQGRARIPVALTQSEQRALISFAERSSRLSAHRQIELANILTPVTGAEGEAAVIFLRRAANGLSGNS